MSHSLSSEEIVFQRLREELVLYVKLWLCFCTDMTPRCTILSCDPEEPSTIPFYISQPKKDDDDQGLEGIDPFLKRAGLLINTCKSSCHAFLDALLARYKNDLDVEKIEWKRSFIIPHFVIFEVTPQEVKYTRCHDYFVFHCRNRLQYVFDITGRQFGFRNFLFTKAEYDADCVEPGEGPPPVNIPDTTREFLAEAFGEFGSEGARALERFRDLVLVRDVDELERVVRDVRV